MRVGADAGDYKISERVIRSVKDSGIKSFYSLMKAYLSTPEELAKEAEILENMGVDEITIMDSAGFMQPEQAREYVAAMKEKVHIPVGFHGHNNLGLALANALATSDAGVDIIDCGLLGMARSARKYSNRTGCSRTWSEGNSHRSGFLWIVKFSGP